MSFVVFVMDRPNPIKIGLHLLKLQFTVRSPSPTGSGDVDHDLFRPTLEALASGGLPAAMEERGSLLEYLEKMASVDPDTLTRDNALAYWINVYNAGSVALALEAFEEGKSSVLRVDKAFRRPAIDIAGESLSLAAIEHVKVRQFKDPRIHGALVCGSLSCPTLRRTPFEGSDIDAQLDEQMRLFLGSGGAERLEDGSVAISRVFLWYGSDYVRPASMPVFLPVPKKRIYASIGAWLPSELKGATKVEFQDYDWGLACKVL